MKTKLSEKQWNQVVTEVTRLAQERDDELTRRDVTTQVLQEMQLPSDLMDEALQQVQYREALARQRRQRIWLAIAGGVLAILIVVSVVTWNATRNSALGKIAAAPGRITQTVASGENLATVTRQGQEIFYQATLHEVPLGEKLQLSCNWIDATGKIFAQTKWETRVTNTEIWPTHCRCRLDAAAPTGNWKVQMKLGDRVLSSTDFKVE